MTIHFADGTTQTSAAGGKLLQVQTSQVTSHTACSPDTQLVFKDIPVSKAITPSASSSKILISFLLFGETNNNSKDHYFRIKRAISGGSTTFITAADQSARTGTLLIGGMGLQDDSGSNTPTILTLSDYVDSPNTTSQVTYTIQHTSHGINTFHLNRTVDTNNQDAFEDGISWITLKEVGA
tara:strand:+ start:1059 stop:1601 length:543 start_codon:yes stop_codon:yes gene_type:complete